MDCLLFKGSPSCGGVLEKVKKALAGLKPEAITTTLMVAHFKTSGLEAGHHPRVQDTE